MKELLLDWIVYGHPEYAGVEVVGVLMVDGNGAWVVFHFMNGDAIVNIVWTGNSDIMVNYYFYITAE